MMALLMVGASPALYTDYPTHNHDCYEIILNSDPEFQVTQALLATGYSKDHLRRRFVQVTGMTPGQYLRSLRIRKGKQLLDTLETFVLDAGMNSGKTAEFMDIHANTVQYRLKKINEMLGVEITGNRVIPGLTMALALKRLERAVS